jgi:hypothetical protein
MTEKNVLGPEDLLVKEPTVDPRRLRVFLAAPSLRLTGSADAVFTLPLRQRIHALRDTLLDAGVAVYSTHHDEAWVTRGVPPERRAPSPFRAIQSADLAFAYVGSPLSAGVGLELGWVSAMRKPVVLLVDRAVAHTPMISTLESVTSVLPLEFDSSWSATALKYAVVTALDWADVSLSYAETA